MSSPFTRRDFLRWATAGAGAAAAAGGVWRLGHADAPMPRSTGPDQTPGGTPAGSPATSRTAVDGGVAPGTPGPATSRLEDRRLVVIELNGGNDGLSTLVPYGLAAYHDLRSVTAIDAADVLAIDADYGFHRNLSRLHQRGIAAVQGVGSYSPDGSHFEMLRRWWAGDADGAGRYDTGFLGRLADLIGDRGAAAVGLSVGVGTSPALISKSVSTLALPNADAATYLTGASSDDVLRAAFQRGILALSTGETSGMLGRVRQVGRQTVDFASMLESMGEEADRTIEYPSSTLGNGLRLTADLVSVDNGVRIIHVPMGSDFDTHDDHVDRHAALLDEFDAAVDAFLADLEQRGAADRVLVMTTSEFGRRAGDQGANGLDHGTASTGLMLGPINPGRHGEHPSLTSLDDNENLVATMGLDSYYASIAEGWFGVPATELFTSPPPLLDGLFA